MVMGSMTANESDPRAQDGAQHPARRVRATRATSADHIDVTTVDDRIAFVPREDLEVGTTRPGDFNARLVDTLVEAIQQRISNGQVPVGTWLRQERLAQE